MNVYDFDKTIYKRDSTVDFYFFELRRQLSLLRFFPHQLVGFIRYFIRNIDITAMKNYFYSFLAGIDDIDEELQLFWDKNISDVHQWYLKRHREDDLVISASPQFLVEEACRRLGISRVIASEVDKKTGKVLSPNCNRSQKVVRMKAAGYDTADINEFYSDSHHDDPLAALARKAWLVRGEELQEWN